MIGIIGGGFGLYGWLPAVATHYPNEKILIAERYKQKFFNIPELHIYYDRIEWIKTPRDIIFKGPSTLILAIPPKSVEYYLHSILNSKTIKTLIVEKPICETPKKSKDFIEQIKTKGIDVISPFLFIFSEWFGDLNYYIHLKDADEVITIDWSFKADHFKFDKNNWKRDHNQGGGPLRFYGIHLIAVLAELGYVSSRQSLDENCYIGVFTQDEYPDIIVKVNTNSDLTHFKINNLINYLSPFNNTNWSDNRIPNIINLLQTMDFRIGMVENITKRTINLWEQVEKQL